MLFPDDKLCKFVETDIVEYKTNGKVVYSPYPKVAPRVKRKYTRKVKAAEVTKAIKEITK